MKPKKKFFFLRIIEAVSKFYNLNAFKKLRRTFVYTFLKMFAFILAILWLQFLILPHLGYVNTSQSLVVDDVDISAQRIDLCDSESTLHISAFEKLVLSLYNIKFIMADHEYSGSFDIELTKITNSISYIDLSYYSNVDLSLVSSLYSNDTAIFFKESTGLYYTTFFNVDQIFMSFKNESLIDLSFSSCNVKICEHHVDDIFEDGVYYQKHTNILIAEGPLSLTIDSCQSLSISGSNRIDMESLNDADVETAFKFYQVKDISCMATGIISFSDSPEKTEYNLQNQLISFKTFSNKSNASLEKNSNDYRLDIGACVYAADISGFDLFPSFRNWYYNNLYLVSPE